MSDGIPGPGSRIRLHDVGIRLGGHDIVSGFSLDIASGEFLCILGPSGCGKSTLLNVLAGFIPAASGRVEVDGMPVHGPSVQRGVVFQSSEALFPWLSVRQNVEYGLRMRGIPKARRAAQADEFIRLVGLGHAADRLPGQLSGGMRQRAQIARVLVLRPPLVLMDEPFGALDAQTRLVMQTELARIRHSTGATVVFVTHDIDEAVLLGDRIAIMTAGPAAGLRSVVPVDLPRPRDTMTPQALELHRRLRTEIGAEVERSIRRETA